MTAERTNTSTFTKTYSTTDTIVAAFPDPTKIKDDYQNVTFSSTFQPYADEAGILTLGYAVEKLGDTARLWNDSNSIYRKKTDPALYLPYRFYPVIDKEEATFKTRDTWATAAKMRGVRFYVPDSGRYTSSVLYPGVKYRIDVPIYNASFVTPSSGVEVSLKYKKTVTKTVTTSEEYYDDDDDEGYVTIGTKTITSLTGWTQGKDTNKAIAQFEWTPPENMAAGRYELVATIDPNNKLDEVHEAWTTSTKDGNNTGYFNFSIGITGQNTAALAKSDFLFSISGQSFENETSIANALKALGNKNEDWFDIEFDLTYLKKFAIDDAWAVLYLYFPDEDGDGEEEIYSITSIIGTLNENDSHSFSFLADPLNPSSAMHECRT